MAKSRLDLPAPFGPTRAIRSPARTAIETRRGEVRSALVGRVCRSGGGLPPAGERRPRSIVGTPPPSSRSPRATSSPATREAPRHVALEQSDRLRTTASAGAKASWRPNRRAAGHRRPEEGGFQAMLDQDDGVSADSSRAAICSKVACIAGGSRFAVGSSRTSRPGQSRGRRRSPDAASRAGRVSSCRAARSPTVRPVPAPPAPRLHRRTRPGAVLQPKATRRPRAT